MRKKMAVIENIISDSLHLIYEGPHSRIYHSETSEYGTAVAVKILWDEYPTPRQIVQFNNEYEFTKDLNLKGIRKAYKHTTIENKYALVLEYVKGTTLKEAFGTQPKHVKDFLNAAIEIAGILGHIHQHQIIHKDINSNNILVNFEEKNLPVIHIIDFGISSSLDLKTQHLGNPEVLEGTLPYISPEQTGRMNRVVDYRTDLYSLGVTLYEMLAQKLPFDVQDALELVYCHIAKQPIPVCEVNPNAPTVLSNIVMKLLAKNAEDRYQSAYGLQFDLDRCLKQLKHPPSPVQKGEIMIETFELGTKDVSSRFRIPQKLYGREQSTQLLLQAFQRVSQGTTELVLVAGHSGVGKSALVHEIHKLITAKHGYFVFGKYDQYQRNIPYSAIIQAVQQLVNYLLMESSERLAQWKTEILQAVGKNGRVLTDIIPGLDIILGPQPPVPELEPKERVNRFNYVFQNFIKTLSQQDHPLMMFLDDLQWADYGSFNFLKAVMTRQDIPYLMVIGAYRESEVTASHPLIITINDIREAHTPVTTLTIGNLSAHDVNSLVADTLHCERSISQSLADVVYAKTQGNAFFVTQLLQSLYGDHVITFDGEKYEWRWDVEHIQTAYITENVVDLLIKKIEKLPGATQQALQFAACIGNEFDVNSLSVIYEHDAPETLAHLRSAIREELLVPLDENYKLLSIVPSHGVPSSQVRPLTSLFRFSHDRVQQAAYALIPDPQKIPVHLKIGRLLLENTPADALEDKVFDIVKQLNHGRELMRDEEEQITTAQLNLLAGKKAKASAASHSAYEYLKSGIDLLQEQCWNSQYELMLALNMEAVEAAYLTDNFEQMEHLLQKVLQYARSTLDTVNAYNLKLKIQVHGEHNKQLEAIATALEVLKLLDIHFPENPGQEEVMREFRTIRGVFAGKEIEELINLPPMTDPSRQAALSILANITPAAYRSGSGLFPLIVFKMLELTAQYGNHPLSSFAYLSHGVFLCGVVGDIEIGYRFGKLALEVIERFNAKDLKPAMFYIFYHFIKHWKDHLRETLPPLQGIYQFALEIGDFRYGAMVAFMYCSHLLHIGKELTAVKQEMNAYRDMIRQLKQDAALNYLEIFRQVVLNLTGDSDTPSRLIGEAYDEQTLLPRNIEANNKYAVCNIYLYKTLLCYLFQEYQEACEHAAQAEKYLDGMNSDPGVPLFYFYDSLARLAVYPDALPVEQEQILEKVSANQQRLKTWADHASMNRLHKWYLVEAERYRVLDQRMQALDCYDRAIALAKEHEYLHEEALAHELAGKFFLAKDKAKLAKVYLLDARYGYLQWGATAKVQHLDEQYPQLLAGISQISGISRSSTTTGYSVDVLDITTIIKASQTISGEIVLDKLLTRLMEIVIENAGAQKGFLLLEEDHAWHIRAESGNLPQPAEGADPGMLFPITLINYVARTREPIVLGDASLEGQFTRDRCILAHQPKSVLCLPLLNQGRLVGILYLENNLTTEAFTPERLEVLNMLSSQAAISIENATLYMTLEHKVKERTSELEQEIKERQRAEEAAKAANQAKSTFLANMSHELRTPLNAILGFAQVMVRNSGMPAEDRKNLGIIHRSGEHLLTLINNVLDLSKIEAGHITLKESHLDLYRLLQDIENMFRLKAEKKHVRLLVTRRADVPQYIWTDDVKLRQILINVLGNAIKFTEEGSVAVRVRSETRSLRSAVVEGTEERHSEGSVPHYKHIQFEIEDTGPGIAPEELERVFEAFAQAKTGREAQEGTGLGLPLSRKFVQLMGGDITVRSEVGQGTTFTFDIVVRTIDTTAVEDASPVCRVMTLAPGQARYRMLIVDDKPTNRQLLVKLLTSLVPSKDVSTAQEQGFELREAANGLEAIEVWKTFQPHLIWMDLRMPVMDGYEATKYIKSEIRNSKSEIQTIIIALTASSLEEDRSRSVSAGCDDFLRKPFQESEIFEKMHTHLGVRFIYEEEKQSIIANRQAIIAKTFTPETLAALSENCRTGLQEAVERLDVEMTTTMIDQIRGQNEPFAEALTHVMKHCRFDRLQELFQPSERDDSPRVQEDPLSHSAGYTTVPRMTSSLPCHSNILIVNDVPQSLLTLTQMLMKHGYKVHPALNGPMALHAAPKILPDVILLGILMPGMDGYEVCRRLKAHETTRDIPVLFMSILNDAMDTVKAFHAGGVDYIPMPFQSEELLARVETHIALRKMQQQLQEQNIRLQQEIIDRKQVEENLQHAKETADAANRAKSEFLSNMSHELRTPLTGILGYAQILQRNRDLSPAIKDGVHIIYQSGEHLLTLINDILDLARIEARKIDIYPTDIHFPSFLDSIAGIIRMRAQQKGISFKYEALTPFPSGIRVDEKRLRQVLLNLLGNAVKFTEKGTVRFRVYELHELHELKSSETHKTQKLRNSQTHKLTNL